MLSSCIPVFDCSMSSDLLSTRDHWTPSARDSTRSLFCSCSNSNGRQYVTNIVSTNTAGITSPASTIFDTRRATTGQASGGREVPGSRFFHPIKARRECTNTCFAASSGLASTTAARNWLCDFVVTHAISETLFEEDLICIYLGGWPDGQQDWWKTAIVCMVVLGSPWRHSCLFQKTLRAVPGTSIVLRHQFLSFGCSAHFGYILGAPPSVGWPS